MTRGVNEPKQDLPGRRAGWSHDWQSRWSHEPGRKPREAVPCSWPATIGRITTSLFTATVLSSGIAVMLIKPSASEAFRSQILRRLSAVQIRSHLERGRATPGRRKAHRSESARVRTRSQGSSALIEALSDRLQRTRNGTELLPDLTIDLIVRETIAGCS
jgi:hypothetical protein